YSALLTTPHRLLPEILELSPPSRTLAPVTPTPNLLPPQAKVLRSKSHILLHRQCEKLVLRILKDVANFPRKLTSRLGSDTDPVDQELPKHLSRVEIRDKTVETSAESSLSTTTRARKKQELSLTNNNIDIVESFRSGTGVLEPQAMSGNDLPLSSSHSLLLTPELVLYNDTISVRAILGLER